jgi:hypothetical protein
VSSRRQFNQAVRIKSIVLHTANSQEGPKLIKLLINRSALGFEDVEDAEEPKAALLVQELPEDTVREGRQIDLKFVRFQSVTSLHVSFDLICFCRVAEPFPDESSLAFARFPRSLSAPIRAVKRRLE